MNAIEQYHHAKKKLEHFNAWASLVGKEYFGGTRGRGGQFGSVVRASGSLTIYHQEFDGANNYHESAEFADEVEEALIGLSPQLIESVRKILEAKLQAKKKEAAALAAELNT